MSIRRWTWIHRAPCHTRKVTDLSNSHNVHGGARPHAESVRPTIRLSSVGTGSMAALVAGTVSAGHEAVVPTQGCIIWCADGQSCSPVITGTDTELAMWDGAAIEAWPPLIDMDIEPVTGIDIGDTECINRTPNTVSAISKPTIGAGPRRPRRLTECMPSTIPRDTPWGYIRLCASVFDAFCQIFVVSRRSAPEGRRPIVRRRCGGVAQEIVRRLPGLRMRFSRRG